MNVSFPKPHDVLEQGVEYVLAADCAAGRAFDEVSVSCVSSGWTGKCVRSIAERARVGADGVVSVRWRVPKDLPCDAVYAVKFAAIPPKRQQLASSSAPTKPVEAEATNVVISTPLQIVRTGRDECVVRWSPGALPTEASARDGWRLALDVVPRANPGETIETVVGDLFLAAATEGLHVHTRRKSVLFDVSKDEATKRSKRLRLSTDRAYKIALAGFTVGELESVFSTSRVEAKMGLVRLRATGGGYNTANSGARKGSLGDAEYRRNAPVVASKKEKELAAKRERERVDKLDKLEKERAAANAAVAKENDAGGGGGGGGGGGATPRSKAREMTSMLFSPGGGDKQIVVHDTDSESDDDADDADAARAAASSAAASSSAAKPFDAHDEAVDEDMTHGGAWKHGEKGAGAWASERGLNVLAVRASDLAVVYDRTWDLSGGRKPAEARFNAASMYHAFAADGALSAGSAARSKWGAHFVAVTTSGAWAMQPSKDGDDYGLGDAIDVLIDALGGDAAVAEAARRAAHKAGAPGQPGAFSAVAACCDRGGRRGTVWHAVGDSNKDRAHVALTLSCADGAWFPTFVSASAGEGASDWTTPWDRWGEEPWSSLKGARGGKDASRVERYRVIVNETRGMMLGGVAAGERGGGGGGERADANASASDAGRVDVSGLLGALLGFASSTFEAFEWGSLGELRKEAASMGKKNTTTTAAEASLVRLTEALTFDLIATRQASVMSELTRAGAGDHLARRIVSLVSRDGAMLPGPAGGGGSTSGGADARKGPQVDAGRAAEVRALAAALSAMLLHNGAASLAEAVRRGHAQDAILRAFLASWRGHLGPRPLAELEALVEELAIADLAVAKIKLRPALDDDGGGGGGGGGGDDGGAAMDTETSGSDDDAEWSVVTALRAGLTYAPAAARPKTTRAKTIGGVAYVLEIEAPAKPGTPLRLPTATPLSSDPAELESDAAAKTEASGGGARSSPPKGTTTKTTNDVAEAAGAEDMEVEPWGGSDAGSDEVVWIGADDPPGASDRDLPDVDLKPVELKRIIKEDPLAQGGESALARTASGVGTGKPPRSSASGGGKNKPAPAPPPTPTPRVSIEGGVAVFRAKDGEWSAHVAMIKQASRLVYLAQSAGAVAAIFLWPKREARHPPVQPLIPSPNYDVPVGIPAFALPAGELESVVGGGAGGRSGAWEVILDNTIDAKEHGSSREVSRRCGKRLAAACAARPSAEAAAAARRVEARRRRMRANLIGVARNVAANEAEQAAMAAAAAAAAELAAAAAENKTPTDVAPSPSAAGASATVFGRAANLFGFSGGEKKTETEMELKEMPSPSKPAPPTKKKATDGGGGDDDDAERDAVDADDGDDASPPKPDASTPGDASDRRASEDYPDPEPAIEEDDDADNAADDDGEPLDALEAARARKWTAAMRVAYALGDEGASILDRSFPSPARAAAEDAASAAAMGASDDSSSRPVRVLCLDGGGIRGLATIVMLERIMKAAGETCVGECFDLILGTSTGGLIAIGAGLLRLSLAEVSDVYDNMAAEVFKSDGYYTLLKRGPGHTAAKAFERLMREKILGSEADQPLYAMGAHQRWYTAGEDAASPRPSPPRVCLVSSLVSRVPSTPYLLRSYRRDPACNGQNVSAVGELPGEHRAGVVHALRATTAAPWYMEELTVDKELGLGKVTAVGSTETPEQQPVGGGISGTSRSASSSELAAAAAFASARGDDDGDGDGDGDDARETDATAEEDPNAEDDPNDATAVDGKTTTSAKDASRVAASLRFIDGAIACNNPTAVGIFEARRLFDRSRPLCVVSLGTGASVPREVAASGTSRAWVENLVNATCDVVQVDATVRHVLGTRDRYHRFQPTDEIFSCDLNDTKEETRQRLRLAAARYMDEDAVSAEVEALAAVLRRS